MKKLTATITAMILAAFLNTSCSRDDGAKAKTPPKDKTMKETNIPGILKQEKINPSDVFSLSRNGEKVTVQIHIDLSACKHVEILRNATGSNGSRMLVATFGGDKNSHEDIAPDAGAYWYWLKVFPPKGKPVAIGPLRMEPDAKNIGKYVDYNAIYKFQVSRNETNARVGWAVPRENFKYLAIARKTNTLPGRRTIVLGDIREWEGQATDVLPDPHADYWYWLDVITEDGAVITRGPVKAEYREE